MIPLCFCIKCACKKTTTQRTTQEPEREPERGILKIADENEKEEKRKDEVQVQEAGRYF